MKNPDLALAERVTLKLLELSIDMAAEHYPVYVRCVEAVLEGIYRERRRCADELIDLGHHDLAHYLALGPQPPIEIGEHLDP